MQAGSLQADFHGVLQGDAAGVGPASGGCTHDHSECAAPQSDGAMSRANPQPKRNSRNSRGVCSAENAEPVGLQRSSSSQGQGSMSCTVRNPRRLRKLAGSRERGRQAAEQMDLQCIQNSTTHAVLSRCSKHNMHGFQLPARWLQLHRPWASPKGIGFASKLHEQIHTCTGRSCAAASRLDWTAISRSRVQQARRRKLATHNVL